MVCSGRNMSQPVMALDQQSKAVLNVQAVADVFHQAFLMPFNTELIGGADEPNYRPSDSQNGRNRLFYRQDYLSSALHEIAHWCIAGSERLQREDFGYWYHPDGRSPEQQHIFEAAELKPQALEWIFSMACGHPFGISVDNLEGTGASGSSFKQDVVNQALAWCDKDVLPTRAGYFLSQLSDRFGVVQGTQTGALNRAHYQLSKLA
jgi:elongation factor P hydroxylase